MTWKSYSSRWCREERSIQPQHYLIEGIDLGEKHDRVSGNRRERLCGRGESGLFVLVLIQMFQRGATGMGIACIVLGFCCGLGGLVAFIYGWVNARAWNINNLMTVWTVAIVINIAAGAINPAPFRLVRHNLNF
jgi:hypothetical protein